MAYLDKAGLIRLCAGLKSKMKECINGETLATGLSWSSGSITEPGWSKYSIISVWIGDVVVMAHIDGSGVARLAGTVTNGSYQNTTTATITSNGDTLSFAPGYEPRMMMHANGGAHQMYTGAVTIKDISGMVKTI